MLVLNDFTFSCIWVTTAYLFLLIGNPDNSMVHSCIQTDKYCTVTKIYIITLPLSIIYKAVVKEIVVSLGVHK